ncbi:Competence protein [Staphylococcus gallinarum]|uniref:Competence protein n=1 Tax=Staphylococcus gallinarum TaxID=1293 RepID=A0A380FDT0_STAGA|nr:Competence protein [Staphylococcus gallinarum]
MQLINYTNSLMHVGPTDSLLIGVHIVHIKYICAMGQKKIAHFAHYKQDDAYCNKGEGAEHYLLKYKLAEYYKVLRICGKVLNLILNRHCSILIS